MGWADGLVCMGEARLWDDNGQTWCLNLGGPNFSCRMGWAFGVVSKHNNIMWVCEDLACISVGSTQSATSPKVLVY